MTLPDCGNAHARLRADDMAWSRAPRVGLRSTPDTSPVVMDVRVCPACEEHVAREVVVEPEKPTVRVRTLDELEAERTER